MVLMPPPALAVPAAALVGKVLVGWV